MSGKEFHVRNHEIKETEYRRADHVFRQISYTLQAGISPAEGLCDHGGRHRLGTVRTDFHTFSEKPGRIRFFCQALKDSGLFPAYAVHMLQIGEYAGCLDETTASLADYYEREEATRQSLKNAVTYPCVMIVIMLAVSGILVAKVLPVFQEVYHQLGSELTGIPLRLMLLGNGIRRFGFPLILLLIILCCIYAVLISQGRAALPFSKNCTVTSMPRGSPTVFPCFLEAVWGPTSVWKWSVN